MTEHLNVAVEDLKRVASDLLDSLQEAEGPSIALERDYFWAIPAEQLYNVYSTPNDLTIGQLSESWNSLGEIGNGASPPNAYALVWLADVLRAIGQEIVR